MWIGELSKKYNVSKDTIRYYIQEGLIIPRSKEKYYDFGERSEKDLMQIISLKELGFTIKEIHKVLSIGRVSNLVDEQDLDQVIDVYMNKRADLIDDMNLLEMKIESIDDKINELKTQKKSEYKRLGIPFSMLNMLVCPSCKSSLSFTDVEMSDAYIYSGISSCQCGNELVVEEGILITGNENDSEYDKPDLNRSFYKDIPPKLISDFQKSYNWMMKTIRKEKKYPVVMETHINAYFFLHQHVETFDEDTLFIVVDKFPEMLKMYKRRLEKLNKPLNILFIADNTTDYPLKINTIDLFIDYFGINEHGFFSNTNLLDEIDCFFKDSCHIAGTCFYFDQPSKSQEKLLDLYPEASKDNFKKKYFVSMLETNGFDIVDHQHLKSTEDTGNSDAFVFHQGHEPLHFFSYFAKKKI